MSIPKLSVSNPVLSNLLMIMIIALGVYAWVTLPRDLIPEIITYTVRIGTLYPGASAEEVEKLVTVRIEEAIENVDQIELKICPHKYWMIRRLPTLMLVVDSP